MSKIFTTGQRVYPSIPDSDGTLVSVNTTLRTMKEAVETVTGQRRGEALGAPLMHLQPTPPSTARTGDLWINSTTNKLSYYTGKSWEAVATS